MNKAFEKILERFDELQEKLLFSTTSIECEVGIINEMEYSKKIVQEVAEEYNNGWIPCSERLPEEPKENPIFDGKALEVYLVTAKYGNDEKDEVYPFRAFWNGVVFTNGLNILDVIAWQSLPEPYPKG